MEGFVYGTAWKEDSTEELTILALEKGFRAIDTANQRKHYFEEGVGKAITKYCKTGFRKDLFIQTKFTYLEGQDNRLPYDKDVGYSEQVRQSFESSLKHLGVDYIDSYLLHGPSSGYGLSKKDWQVWEEMEKIKIEGGTKVIGVSNVNLQQLKELFEKSEVKPSFVQNRCFAQTGWDKEVRDFCKKNKIQYQGFSLLTANPFVLNDSKVKKIAKNLMRTPEQIIFRFAIHVGMIPLTGTSNPVHMEQDLTCVNFFLSEEEIKMIEEIAR